MSSRTTTVVTGPEPVTPSNVNPNVKRVGNAETYPAALKLASQLENALPASQIVAIYRLSKGKDRATSKDTFYLSRQVADPSDGNENHPPVPEGEKEELGYELYSAPVELLSKSTPPREPALSSAVASARAVAIAEDNAVALKGKLDPKPTGPNVVGPNPPPPKTQLDPKPTGPNVVTNPPPKTQMDPKPTGPNVVGSNPTES